jgi:hypothetical protein
MVDKSPMVCEAGLEFTILMKEIQYSDGWVGNVHHVVNIFHDGSVFMKEMLVKPLGKKELLNSATAHNFEEFSGKFPLDAEVILKFLAERNVNIPWINGGN